MARSPKHSPGPAAGQPTPAQVANPQSTLRPVEQAAARPVEQAAARPVEQAAARPVEQAAARPVEQAAARPVEHPVEQAAARPVEQASARPVEQADVRPVDQTAARPAAVRPFGQRALPPVLPAVSRLGRLPPTAGTVTHIAHTAVPRDGDKRKTKSAGTDAKETRRKKRNPYTGWSLVKDMRLGSRSKRVWLLRDPADRDNLVVLKTYDTEDPHHRARFAKEIAVMRRLKGCPYTPKLHHVDKKRCALWMSYCGPVARLTPDVKKAVKHHLQHMAERYGVFRIHGNDHRPTTDPDAIFEKNITELNGRIFIIDFGSGSYTMNKPAKVLSAPARQRPHPHPRAREAKTKR